MSGQAPRRLQRGRRAARRTLQRPVSARGGRTSALCTSGMTAGSHKIAGRSGARREARRTARVFGSTHARRTAGVGPRGRRARPRRHSCRRFFALAGNVVVLVSWRPIPLRHAEACAAGRCRESTHVCAPHALGVASSRLREVLNIERVGRRRRRRSLSGTWIGRCRGAATRAVRRLLDDCPRC
ncbi:hypothetical protein EVAR_62672_1 [Eumeta japonica]|uniref:Uncharacterized protein n=1 Tax=Eumeta variegata TaxID=151549 RepID=A0A4C1YZK5_EUMVA|nr:hypothetical protein EVAR_62672_1 [Eumeta japonica]